MVKTAEITNVEEYGKYLIRPIRFGWMNTYNGMVHIAVAEGEAEDQRYLITGCNRPVKDWSYMDEFKLFGHTGREVPDMCPVCMEKTGATMDQLVENIQRYKHISELASQTYHIEHEVNWMWRKIGESIVETISQMYDVLSKLPGYFRGLDLVALATGDEELITERAKFWENYWRLWEEEHND